MFARSITRTLLGLALIAAPTFAQSASAADADIERRLDRMMGQLTIEQKIDLLGGVDQNCVRAIPEIGLPQMRGSDGPLGVREWGPSTAYAGGVALAATWDTALAQRLGVALGRDARARGVHFLFGPGLNIYRAPMNGRNFEYFGEDPFLAARLAVAYVQGVQSQGVVATIKHFAANNAEYDRRKTNAIVEERALREIYFPAFEAAVKEGRVGAVMSAYNLLNGEYATANAWLNRQVLKREWGFDGIFMSDWGATHETLGAANSGLDLEMPAGRWMNRETLLPAIKSGAVPLAAIDDKVRRILRTALRFHFLDRPQFDPTIPLDSPESRSVALATAQESVTLLKNESQLLPLDKTRVHRIAVIGPNADWPVVSGGGAALTTPFAADSLLIGVRDVAGASAQVDFHRGIKSLPEIFGSTTWFLDAEGKHRGLKQEEFAGGNFSGVAKETVVADLNAWHGTQWAPAARPRLAERFTGYFLPQESGAHFFVAAGTGRDSYKLWVEDRLVLEWAEEEGHSPQSVELQLEVGKPVAVRLEYLPMTDHLTMGLGVIAAAKLVDPVAMALAAAADVVVVAVGFEPRAEGEGFDRSYRLPVGQDQLIRAMRAANSRTIIVLNAGGGVDTSSWIERVPVFLHAYYGGQASGRAIAQALFGEINPSGRLPFSFERRIEDNPCFAHYDEEPGTHDVRYAEGVFVGYRHYDRATVKPLFPFGFGLSYATFEFSHLSATPAQSRGDEERSISFDVRNTSSRAGATVAQLYVGDPSAKIERPLKELKGFQRVVLDAGETKRVSFTLDRRALAYWDVAAHDWRVDPGSFTIYVGDSSANVPLRTDFEVR